MTRKEMAQLINELMVVYPHIKIDKPEATVRAWLLILGEYSAEEVFKGARYHMETSQFFPTPADIRKAIPKGMLKYQQSEAPQIAAPEEEVEEYEVGCDICPYNNDCIKEKCIV